MDDVEVQEKVENKREDSKFCRSRGKVYTVVHVGALLKVVPQYHSDNTLRSVLSLSFLHCRIFWEHHFNNSSINSAAAVQQAFRIKYGAGQCVASVW